MWRYCYTICKNIFRILEALKTMEDYTKLAKERPNEYNEEVKYRYVQYITYVMQRTGNIETEVYGEENLPNDGGYMMFPNHQGKYDVYSMMSVHREPCTFVIDIKKSNFIFIKQLVDILEAKRLDKQNNRQAMTVINEVAKEVGNGRKYILFPEGFYDNKKKNSLIEFKSGCFKICLKSKVPIVPVVLIDSYKPYNSWCFGKIKTQVHYLEPIFYDEYKDLSTHEIAELVKNRIASKIEEVERWCS
ncbi:MAG: 1-acyl-sn-glycerol-3-phosphate acyltransferase [Clostridia bacterium]|nr:1-acyl-sn-glycerol-3-phosphate acyltransferase [Clostridia bacterium]